jgi:type II secretory pathway pseudopilin PulG
MKKSKTSRKKAAFTLAETLIAIGIIGVVSALTIPTLMHKYRETVMVNKLKKTYSELQQAVKLSEAENGDTTGWDYSIGSANFAEKYIMPYLAKSHSKNKGAFYRYSLNGTSKGRQADTSYYYVDKVIGISARHTARTDMNDIDYADIFVDLNGDSGANRLGNDVFQFTIFNYTYKTGGWVLTSVCPRGEHYGLYLGSISGYWGGHCATSVDAVLGGDSVRGDCISTKGGNNCGLAIQKNNWKVPKGYPVKY